MKNILTISLFILFTAPLSAQNEWQGPSVDFANGPLEVSDNGRFLVHKNGRSFFYLGDTAWELFHCLSREEAEAYLQNRRSKGFTVIQAVALAEMNGLNEGNYYGEKPFLDSDHTQPNEKYFEHVDWIISKAEEKGIYIGLLPTWGDKVDRQWGVGPVVFDAEKAADYGKWIAKRYKERPNIIWINGGDRSGGGENTVVWNALGNAIKSVDKNHLMTYHPVGGNSSSKWFHTEEWLDFNMMQSGHSDRYIPNYNQLSYDRSLDPVKPTLDGEPCYEEHAINWNPQFGWFDDADIRQMAYWGLLSGTCGTTYGAHPIWQFYDLKKTPVTHARMHWRDAMDLPGAFDMMHVRQLFESRDWMSLEPANEIILNNSENESKMMAAKGEDFAIVYAPFLSEINIDRAKLFEGNFNAWWYNPRTGTSEAIDTSSMSSHMIFRHQVTGIDWVLVIDRKDAGYGPPGEL
ncbi:MAG: glycoside hydrolase family 140 protein [Bacteroidales bacterium]|nr:glycoside hydrolase family 140 protein [Bacteroidales bacterium]